MIRQLQLLLRPITYNALSPSTRRDLRRDGLSSLRRNLRRDVVIYVVIYVVMYDVIYAVTVDTLYFR